MALASLFKKRANHGSIISIDDEEIITMDATISESPTFTNEVTENPVEDGSSIVDHIIARPVTVRVEGIISDTPVRFLSGVRDALSEGLGGDSRSKAAFDAIEKLMLDKSLVTLVTRYKDYTSMAITDFQPSRDASTGDALSFNMTLKSVIVVESQTVDIPRNNVGDTPPGTQDQGQSTTGVGKQGVAEAGAGPTNSASVLFKVFKFVGIV